MSDFPDISYKVRVEAEGLLRAPEIYGFYIRRHLEKLGLELQADVRGEQREDTGAERRATTYRIKESSRGGLSFVLRVSNPTIQAAVDETGAKPHFPPYKKGSKLFKWVQRKGLGSPLLIGQRRALGQLLGAKAAKAEGEASDKRQERVSFLIARAQSRRGLPRPGDWLVAPFKTVEAHKRDYIQASFQIPFLLATKRINDFARKGNGG